MVFGLEDCFISRSSFFLELFYHYILIIPTSFLRCFPRLLTLKFIKYQLWLLGKQVVPVERQLSLFCCLCDVSLFLHRKLHYLKYKIWWSFKIRTYRDWGWGDVLLFIGQAQKLPEVTKAELLYSSRNSHWSQMRFCWMRATGISL